MPGELPGACSPVTTTLPSINPVPESNSVIESVPPASDTVPLFAAVLNACDLPPVENVAAGSTTSELAAASAPERPSASVPACTRVWPV